MEDDMRKEIRRIQLATNYFDVLQLELPNVTTIDVKKAHHRLVLLCHPDRCKLDGANEAFDEVTKAFDLLRDQDVLDRFIEMWQDKQKRDVFLSDARNVQKAEEERKRKRAAGLPDDSDEPNAKQMRAAEKLEKQMDTFRAKAEGREERRKEKVEAKLKAEEEEKEFSQTRSSWNSWQKGGKKMRGRVAKTKRESRED
eukprot:TRINITY_DN112418_c0_g1_i1.p1 TRINITY_DN112418_c0_g1~~TRINITY_DN112418_c0_g1_i1.p1  ORF type:complete len:198 (+),score=31.29 TRINITY_DN112418_c0_g1_i1:40-633(+)